MELLNDYIKQTLRLLYVLKGWSQPTPAQIGAGLLTLAGLAEHAAAWARSYMNADEQEQQVCRHLQTAAKQLLAAASFADGPYPWSLQQVDEATTHLRAALGVLHGGMGNYDG